MQLFQINQSEDSSKITIKFNSTCVQLHQRSVTSAFNNNRTYSILAHWWRSLWINVLSDSGLNASAEIFLKITFSTDLCCAASWAGCDQLRPGDNAGTIEAGAGSGWRLPAELRLTPRYLGANKTCHTLPALHSQLRHRTGGGQKNEQRMTHNNIFLVKKRPRVVSGYCDSTFFISI